MSAGGIQYSIIVCLPTTHFAHNAISRSKRGLSALIYSRAGVFPRYSWLPDHLYPIRCQFNIIKQFIIRISKSKSILTMSAFSSQNHRYRTQRLEHSTDHAFTESSSLYWGILEVIDVSLRACGLLAYMLALPLRGVKGGSRVSPPLPIQSQPPSMSLKFVCLVS